MKDKDYFSKEYIDSSQKTTTDMSSEINKNVLIEQEKIQESAIDYSYYHIAKPKRQIIFGKIVNDKNN